MGKKGFFCSFTGREQGRAADTENNEEENESTLTRVMVNSFKSDSTTTGYQATYKNNGKWAVQNRLLWAESFKARVKAFINEKQRGAKLRFAKDLRDWTMEDWSKVSPIFSCSHHLAVLQLDRDLKMPTSHSVSHPP